MPTMKKYHVYVTRVATYEVEADDLNEAIDAVLHGAAEAVSEDTTNIATDEA